MLYLPQCKRWLASIWYLAGLQRDSLPRTLQVVREDSQFRQQARVCDEADPFARLHAGRRLYLPSLAPGDKDNVEGNT